MNATEYLKATEWSMGCGGNRNQGQCPECCGVSRAWADSANPGFVKQFGRKRVEDKDVGHKPDCKLGTAIKESHETPTNT